MSEDKQKAGDKTKDGGIVMRGHTDAERRVYADIAHELYKVAADLERTREINPPKEKEEIVIPVFYAIIEGSKVIDEDSIRKEFEDELAELLTIK
jgi:hypothetical protein